MNTIDETKKEFEEEEFQDLNYDNIALNYLLFEDSTFTNCKFRQCDFKGSKFLNCSFINCDLNNIQVENSNFQDCTFIESKLNGINWCCCLKLKIKLFEKCNISYSTFMNLDLRKIKIIDCIAYETDFREANLQNSIVTGIDLKGTAFFQSNHSGADFRNSKNYDIDVLNNKVAKAIFSPIDALNLLKSLQIILK
jgi:fluoroquinolone resistance protein